MLASSQGIRDPGSPEPVRSRVISRTAPVPGRPRRQSGAPGAVGLRLRLTRPTAPGSGQRFSGSRASARPGIPGRPGIPASGVPGIRPGIPGSVLASRGPGIVSWRPRSSRGPGIPGSWRSGHPRVLASPASGHPGVRASRRPGIPASWRPGVRSSTSRVRSGVRCSDCTRRVNAVLSESTRYDSNGVRRRGGAP